MCGIKESDENNQFPTEDNQVESWVQPIHKRVNIVPIEELRRGKRLKSAPLKLVKNFISSYLPPKALFDDASDLLYKEPNNFKDAIKSEKWNKAMNEEFHALMENKT